MILEVPWTAFAAAVTLGLAGSLHCVAMCGGIAAAAGTRARVHGATPRPVGAAVAFNAGRVAGYALLGALAGALVGVALGPLPVRPLAVTLRVVAALLMALLALQLLLGRDLLALERAGGALWRKLQPLAGRALALPGPLRFAALGVVWGFLPCGLVYSAAALAATTGSAGGAALTMVAFGLGTLPSMLGMTLAGTAMLRRGSAPGLRIAAGVLMLGFAVWTALGPLAPHAGHGAANTERAADEPGAMHHH